MKQLNRIVLILLSCSGLAYAGGKEVVPLPPPPGCDWTGFYLGLKVGGAWTGDDRVFAEPLLNGRPDPMASLRPNSVKLDPSGVIGGGEVGYNFQFCQRWVVGAEADFFGADMSQGAITGVTLNGRQFGGLTANQDIDWFGTVRARLGYLAAPKVLLYATGGFAYADIKDSADVGSSFVSYPASSRETQTGWTAGGGVEYKIGCHWSVKAEYLYFDVGDRTLVGSEVRNLRSQEGGNFATAYRFDGTFHTVTVGLNYQF
ncbi:MAG: porin family protein [Verrucomicrobiota bacterium]|nr:porin family protein [Verrucomicrobiota bacterium]